MTLDGAILFQHTAARRRLGFRLGRISRKLCFNTQPPEGGWLNPIQMAKLLILFQHTAARRRLDDFNINETLYMQFQHTAARRRLVALLGQDQTTDKVSTHSRPKAAGFTRIGTRLMREVSTHSRPKAAGVAVAVKMERQAVSTHSRPKAAGPIYRSRQWCNNRFNTQPPEGGW